DHHGGRDVQEAVRNVGREIADQHLARVFGERQIGELTGEKIEAPARYEKRRPCGYPGGGQDCGWAALAREAPGEPHRRVGRNEKEGGGRRAVGTDIARDHPGIDGGRENQGNREPESGSVEEAEEKEDGNRGVRERV